ncbi:MAG: VOC family protein [Planctomycetes bacterium]|nr:VOC family protein [Planctomycetota bacterium]
MVQSPEESWIRSSRDPRELFDRGLEHFARGEVEEAIATLREGFFENVHMAPVLLRIPFRPQDLWYPGPSASPDAARAYADAERPRWQQVPSAIRFLRSLWNDPLVRREIESYINFCKSFQRTLTPRVRRDLASERLKFTNPERIRRTQNEIVARIRDLRFDLPPPPPRVLALEIPCADPEEGAQFLRLLLGVLPIDGEPAERPRFLLRGLEIVFVRRADAPPCPLRIALRVDDIEFYARRAQDLELAVEETGSEDGARHLIVRAPFGPRFELIEEEEKEGRA